MDKKTAIAKTILPAGKTDLKTSEQNPVKEKTASGIEAAGPAIDESRLVNQSEQTSEAKGTCRDVKGQAEEGSSQIRKKSERPQEQSEQPREESKRPREESEQSRTELEQPREESEQPREASEQPREESKQSRTESEQLKEASEQLKEESEQLRGESGQFPGGSEEFQGGSEEFRGESRELQDGSGQLREGSGQLREGYGQLQGGSEQLQGGYEQFQEGSEEFLGGSGKFLGGSGKFLGGSGEFQGGSGEFQGGSHLRENKASLGAGLGENGLNSANNGVFMNGGGQVQLNGVSMNGGGQAQLNGGFMSSEGPVQLEERLSSSLGLPEAGGKLPVKGVLHQEAGSDLHSLLRNNAAGDVKAGIKLKDSEVVIPLNDEVRFVFSDENTISKIIIKGIINRQYLKRQRVQAKTTPLKLEGPLRKINQFVRVSKRDYFSLIAGAMPALKFRRNEVKYTAQFVNILLFALANGSFTYKEIMENFGISRTGMIRIVAKMKSVGWVGYNSALSKRYLYLTEGGMGFIRDAVERGER